MEDCRDAMWVIFLFVVVKAEGRKTFSIEVIVQRFKLMLIKKYDFNFFLFF
jgi:hypothetical protein